MVDDRPTFPAHWSLICPRQITFFKEKVYDHNKHAIKALRTNICKDIRKSKKKLRKGHSKLLVKCRWRQKRGDVQTCHSRLKIWCSIQVFTKKQIGVTFFVYPCSCYTKNEKKMLDYFLPDYPVFTLTLLFLRDRHTLDELSLYVCHLSYFFQACNGKHWLFSAFAIWSGVG